MKQFLTIAIVFCLLTITLSKDGRPNPQGPPQGRPQGPPQGRPEGSSDSSRPEKPEKPEKPEDGQRPPSPPNSVCSPACSGTTPICRRRVCSACQSNLECQGAMRPTDPLWMNFICDTDFSCQNACGTTVCAAETAVCDLVQKQCVACTTNAQCVDWLKSQRDPEYHYGKCEAGVCSKGCQCASTPATPICDRATLTCKGCSTNAECVALYSKESPLSKPYAYTAVCDVAAGTCSLPCDCDIYGTTPMCESGACAACTDSLKCKTLWRDSTATCNTSTGGCQTGCTCDITSATPVCLSGTTCSACREDSQCVRYAAILGQPLPSRYTCSKTGATAGQCIGGR